MVEVEITARQPLALGTRPTGTAPTDTHQHIPGTVLRGALAAAWIRDHGAPTRDNPRREEFLALFEGGVRYGPLFHPYATVVPLSVKRCKYRPDPGCIQIQFAGDEAADGPVKTRCGHCEGPLAAGRGEVEFFGLLDGERVTGQATRVGLTADETADEGQLFTRRELWHLDGTGEKKEARAFTGRIVLPAGTPGADWLLAGRQLLLGGRRSTGGAADYTTGADLPADIPPETISARLLLLRLTAPAVLVDDAGRPTDRLDECIISELLGVGVIKDEGRRWVRRGVVSGWHAASNLPKPAEHVVLPGSVYELLLDGDPGPEGVRRLLDHGIGLRRAEGFGWIEAGPWQPPTVPPPPDPPAGKKNLIDGMTDTLYGLGPELARWFVNELREYRLRRARGGAPSTALLDRPKLHRLNPEQRRHVKLLLTHPQVDDPTLHAILTTLEARIREGAR